MHMPRKGRNPCALSWVPNPAPRLHADGLLDRNGGKPAETVFMSPIHDSIELLADSLGHRSRCAGPDNDLIDRVDGSDLCRRAAEEQLLADIEHFARNDLLNHRNAQLL